MIISVLSPPAWMRAGTASGRRLLYRKVLASTGFSIKKARFLIATEDERDQRIGFYPDDTVSSTLRARDPANVHEKRYPAYAQSR